MREYEVEFEFQVEQRKTTVSTVILAESDRGAYERGRTLAQIPEYQFLGMRMRERGAEHDLFAVSERI